MGKSEGRGDRKYELKIITKEILNIIINYWESLIIIMDNNRVVLEGYYERVAWMKWIT